MISLSPSPLPMWQNHQPNDCKIPPLPPSSDPILMLTFSIPTDPCYVCERGGKRCWLSVLYYEYRHIPVHCASPTGSWIIIFPHNVPIPLITSLWGKNSEEEYLLDACSLCMLANWLSSLFPVIARQPVRKTFPNWHAISYRMHRHRKCPSKMYLNLTHVVLDGGFMSWD